MENLHENGTSAQAPNQGTAVPLLTNEQKRLFLQAHFNLLFRKLRRGVLLQREEILDLMPFTDEPVQAGTLEARP